MGSVFFSTTSQGKLVFLINVVGVFEYEVDENGFTSGKVRIEIANWPYLIS
jgi:hypothetical protein